MSSIFLEYDVRRETVAFVSSFVKGLPLGDVLPIAYQVEQMPNEEAAAGMLKKITPIEIEEMIKRFYR